MTDTQPDEVPIPDFATLFGEAIKAGMENSPRTQQSRAGRIGPSDIGFCRNKTVLTIKEVQPSNSSPSWAAAVGTAIHEWTGQQLKDMFPDWIIPMPEDGDKYRVTAHLPRTGAEITGTPDTVIPKYNAVLDTKTKDGLLEARRYGSSQNNKMQLHLYAKGCLEAGLLDPSRPVIVGNVFIDRSGRELTPYVDAYLYEEAYIDEIEDWVEDCIYAVRNGEEGSRDIPASRCEKFCEFFTACRGSLPMHDPEPIVDPEIVHGIDMFVEGAALIKQGNALKREAKSILDGVNGSDGRFQVRWVRVEPTAVDSFTRAGYDRLDVVKVKK